MLEDIALHAQFSADQIGKNAIGASVMAAIGRVARHEFVPAELRPYAYLDTPLPIGAGKTISQPFMVALMVDLLDLAPGHKVLEIGTGLGYQSAVLGQLGARVFSIEIMEELSSEAGRRLREQDAGDIELRLGDGAQGWPDHAPFDRIIVAAAPELMPPALFGQLKPGGRMVIPAGIEGEQELLIVEKDEAGIISTRPVMRVVFAPFVVSH